MRLKAGVAESTQRPLCFQCYRAGLAREQAMARAAQLDTGSAARFHDLLPLEPVNKPRLDRLRMERAAARARARISAAAACVDRRRHAQIAARHALQQIGGGLHSRDPREREAFAAARAAELQLPESWLPFVVAQ